MINSSGLAGQDALVTFRAQPTAQAAQSLGAGLFLGQAQLHLAEVPGALLNRGGGNPHPRLQVHLAASQHLGHLFVGQLGHRQGGEFARSKERRPTQVAVNGQRPTPSGGNSLDERARPGGGIAPGKHPWPVGGHGLRVYLEGALGGDL